MLDGGPKLDITIEATHDAETVNEGAETAEGASTTSTSSSLGSASLEKMMVTRGMPNLVAAAAAPIDSPEVLDLLLMAFFFLSP